MLFVFFFFPFFDQHDPDFLIIPAVRDAVCRCLDKPRKSRSVNDPVVAIVGCMMQTADMIQTLRRLLESPYSDLKQDNRNQKHKTIPSEQRFFQIKQKKIKEPEDHKLDHEVVYDRAKKRQTRRIVLGIVAKLRLQAGHDPQQDDEDPAREKDEEKHGIAEPATVRGRPDTDERNRKDQRHSHKPERPVCQPTRVFLVFAHVQLISFG